MSGLTKAQRAFLAQLRCFRDGRGFSRSILRGSETAMAERLVAAGLVEHVHHMRDHESYYVLTPAGRAALSQSPLQEGNDHG